MNNSNSTLTAFILAGGKSSRIGTNKSLLQISGKTIIQFLVEMLNPIFSEVVISSNEPESFEFLGKKIIKDIYPGRGPLSGIDSALNFTSSERNFIIGSDMPVISSELINYLIDYRSDSEILIPKADGKIQALCGIYSKAVLPEVEDLLDESSKSQWKLKGSVYELLNKVKTEFIKIDELDFYHPNLFLNINTPEDYELAKSILEKK